MQTSESAPRRRDGFWTCEKGALPNRLTPASDRTCIGPESSQLCHRLAGPHQYGTQFWACAASALLLFLAIGCDGKSSKPQLIRARFLDETADGIAQPGESILLVFDRHVQLRQPTRSGLRFEPSGEAGAYTISPGPDARTLRVDLGIGKLTFEPQGIFGDPTTPGATGIGLDLDAIGGVADASGALTGLTKIVDLEPSHADPALLEAARWVDRDESSTVNEGDSLVLKWDRPVEPSPTFRQYALIIPDDLLILPIEGDRIDDGATPSRVEPLGRPDRETTLILGSGPRLTVQGDFDPGAARFPGSASGVAIAGTRVRPHLALRDLLGIGISSNQVVDIGGECTPFTAVAEPFPRAGVLSGHAATQLPDGRVVITGGWRETLNGPREVSDEVWIYDPWDGRFHGPEYMAVSRALHTATYMPGADGEEDTSDDFILIVGGSTGRTAQHTSEILLTKLPLDEGNSRRSDRFRVESSILDGSSNHLSQRFQHTAHRIPGTSTVVLVGGKSSNNFLNRTVESIEIDYRGGLPSRAYKREIGSLRAARIEHQSILIDSPIGPLLFVLGGYGGTNIRGAQVELAEGTCEVLSAPELLAIDSSGGSVDTIPWLLSDDLLEPRRGARIIELAEEDHPWLLVGGTDQLPFLKGDPSDECAIAYRFDINVAGVQIGHQYPSPSLSLIPAGKLQAPRAGLEGVLLEDGRVLLVGGTISEEASPLAELYDPLAGPNGSIERVCRELLAPRGSFPRRDFTVTPTYDDQLVRQRILIVGGAEPGDLGIELFGK